MDSITHILSAVIVTEPLPVPAVEEGAVYARWRERLAILLAALLPDADGVLGWIDPALYARYHRVATHSVLGLVILVFLSAWIARAWPETLLPPFVRRRYAGQKTIPPAFRRLLAFASVAIVCHWLGDWVARWGIWPLWPFWNEDVALGRVNSLDGVLLALTVTAWAIQHLFLVRGKRRAGWIVAATWILLFAAYVWLRPYWGPPAYV
ncbi:metal-dependent hydrolase [Candidatus Sumerlaeota bacterium]|nr:metal-dependent hydrolase [Candidatus Sumerlaeota bacterium]